MAKKKGEMVAEAKRKNSMDDMVSDEEGEEEKEKEQELKAKDEKN